MVVKIDGLDQAIQKELETYSADISKNVNQNLKEVADTTADTLKKGGSYRERTGKYTPDWSVTTRPGRSVMQGEEYSVHNRKHYQLTHLLEKGHVTRSGSRTRAFVHIATAEHEAQDLAVKAVEDAVRTANGGI